LRCSDRFVASNFSCEDATPCPKGHEPGHGLTGVYLKHSIKFRIEMIGKIPLKIEKKMLDAFAKNRQDIFKHSGAAALTSVGHGCKRALYFPPYGFALMLKVL
jgi:hypothetical protein